MILFKGEVIKICNEKGNENSMRTEYTSCKRQRGRAKAARFTIDTTVNLMIHCCIGISLLFFERLQKYKYKYKIKTFSYHRDLNLTKNNLTLIK